MADPTADPETSKDGMPHIAVCALLVRMALDRQVYLPIEVVEQLQRLNYLPHNWHIWSVPGIPDDGVLRYLVAHPYVPKPHQNSTLVAVVKIPLPPS